MLSAHPLPTERERVIIYVCFNGHDADAMAKEVDSLANRAQEEVPRHHLSTFLEAPAASQSSPPEARQPRAGVDAANSDAAYSAAFAAALAKAIKKGRLSEDVAPPEMRLRPSFTDAALTAKSDWLRAQVDIYHMMATHKAQLENIQAGLADCEAGYGPVLSLLTRGLDPRNCRRRAICRSRTYLHSRQLTNSHDFIHDFPLWPRHAKVPSSP